MKHVFNGMLALIVVGVLIVGSGVANERDENRSGLVRRDYDFAAGQNYGCKEVGIYKDSMQLAAETMTFTLPNVEGVFGYLLTVGFVDTVAAAAVATDSMFFRLVRRPDGFTAPDTTADLTDDDGGWFEVYTFTPHLSLATNWPQSKHIPLDSVAVYPIGPGTYKWLIFGGGVQTDHWTRKAYKVACIIEYDPKVDE